MNVSILTPTAEMVAVDRIDSSDETLAITPLWFPLGKLLESVRKTGIISPLHLQHLGRGQLRIAMGFRRYRAAEEAGMSEVPAVIWRQRSDFQLFKEALLEKMAFMLHDLERAIVLVKLQDQFEVGENVLMDRYLPLLGIAPSRYRLRHYLGLGHLSETLQRSVHGNLDSNIALRLVKWKEPERQQFLDLLNHYQPSLNRQKTLFDLLEDLRSSYFQQAQTPGLSGSWFEQIWYDSGAKEANCDDRLSRPEQFNRILECLHRLRQPNLYQYQKHYQILKESLKMPPQIRLQIPPYFEGDSLSVSFSSRNVAEFRHLVKKLEEMSRREELGKIFELL